MPIRLIHIASAADVDGMVSWGVMAFLLIIGWPLLFIGLYYGQQTLNRILGMVIYYLFKPLLAVRFKGSKRKPQQNLKYAIKKEERPFSLRDEKGKLRLPSDDETVQLYKERNSHYPDIDSEEYKQAVALNMGYFVSEAYPYDYIVMGDRAQIEEVRKGARLTKEEELLIWLGYGYDGEPFGTPWGLEEECLNGYLYAQEQGDFLEWNDDLNKYHAYLGAGYEPPKDQYDGINRDTIHSVEFRIEDYGYKKPRLNKETLKRKQNNQSNENVVSIN